VHQEPGLREDETAKLVVDAALRVHRALGPGLLESVYEQCLGIELETRGAPLARQVVLPVRYAGHVIENALRIDILVNSCVIVEIKAVEMLKPIHSAQLLTYLRLSGLRVGLLINFNSVLLKDGIKRLAV
jgi:GxxExxY protein